MTETIEPLEMGDKSPEDALRLFDEWRLAHPDATFASAIADRTSLQIFTTQEVLNFRTLGAGADPTGLPLVRSAYTAHVVCSLWYGSNEVCSLIRIVLIHVDQKLFLPPVPSRRFEPYFDPSTLPEPRSDDERDGFPADG